MKMSKKVALSYAMEALSNFAPAELRYAGEEEGVSTAEVLGVLNGMVEQLSKPRTSTATRKPTPKQIENEAVKADILALMAEGVQTIPALLDGITVDTREQLTCQRVSALLTQLKNDGKVVRGEGKVAIFTLAVQPSADEVEE